MHPHTRALGLLALAVGVGAATLLAQAPQIPLRVPAKSMKERADFVRADMIATHLRPGKAYPFAKIFNSASMTPTDGGVVRLLTARGGGGFAVTPLAPTAAELMNVAATPLDIPMNALLEGQVLRLIVRLPARCVLEANWAGANTLNVTPKDPATNAITVTFRDLPRPRGVPLAIASVQRVDSLTVSDAAITLVTTGRSGKGIRLTLDLTH